MTSRVSWRAVTLLTLASASTAAAGKFEHDLAAIKTAVGHGERASGCTTCRRAVRTGVVCDSCPGAGYENVDELAPPGRSLVTFDVDPRADVYVDGRKVLTVGAVKHLWTPELKPDVEYKYVVRVSQKNERGRLMTAEEEFFVEPDAEYLVTAVGARGRMTIEIVGGPLEPEEEEEADLEAADDVDLDVDVDVDVEADA